jgi:hypothetical protein
MSPQTTLWIAGGPACALFLGLWLFWLLLRVKKMSVRTWLKYVSGIRLLGLLLAIYGAVLFLGFRPLHAAAALMGASSGVAITLIAWMQISIVKYVTRPK